MTVLRIRDYRVLFDGQAEGWDTIGGTVLQRGDEWIGVFGSGPHEDDDAGQHPFEVRSRDRGRTWSRPRWWPTPIEGDRTRQSVGLSLFGPTAAGTWLAQGTHMQLEADAEGRFRGLDFRAYTLLLGRRAAGDGDFTWRRCRPGTFLGEQFMERGLQLPSGRLVFAIWGSRRKGENWRCGVLLSDDDGVTWRYRDVGYEPSLEIRDRPPAEGVYPAGFNEQSLFRLPSGRLVSLIRGREKLGRVADSPRDTWFFRSVSDDDGESWSTPMETNIAGTGAAGVGLSLPDGGLLHAARVPYSRTLVPLPDPDRFGLHLARSDDDGATWRTESVIQQDPEGTPFDDHYNAMNGQWLPLDDGACMYVFGQFDVKRKIYRILALELEPG